LPHLGVAEDDPCPVEQAVSRRRTRRPQASYGERDHRLGDVILDEIIANSFLEARGGINSYTPDRATSLFTSLYPLSLN